MDRDGENGDRAPDRPASSAASLEHDEEREIRERARKQEEAVHARVDAVEEQHPAPGDEERSEERDGAAREPREKRGDGRYARNRRNRRDEPEPGQAGIELHHDPGGEEV